MTVAHSIAMQQSQRRRAFETARRGLAEGSNLVIQDSGDGCFTNAVLLCQPSPQSAITRHGANSLHLSTGQGSGSIPLAKDMSVTVSKQAIDVGEALVALRQKVFEIISTSIRMDAVYVINVVARWPWPKKGSCYQTVNVSMPPVCGSVKYASWVTLLKRCFKNLADVGAFAWHHAPHSTEARYVVPTLPAYDRPPLLKGIIRGIKHRLIIQVAME